MFLIILTVTTTTILCAEAHKFGYDGDDGPSHWPGVCLTGERQSPVDIKAFDIDVAPLPPLLFMNYERVGDITLQNNGHSVSGVGFERWGDKRPYIHGGLLNGTYELLQFHFHWSQHNDSGSEHTIASLHYPGELHLVHTKKDPAPNEVNTVAVVGVFMALGDNAEPLQNLKPYILSVTTPGTEKAVRGFSVNSFLPSHLENFYRYDGSLTTPGCDESVVWTLMADPITVTPSQMQALRGVQFASGKIGDNWRPAQPLNGRRILFRPTNFSARQNAAPTVSGNTGLRLMLETLIAAWLCNKIALHHAFSTL